MRIAFDHQAFVRQPFGGVSRYFCRLANELAKHGEHDLRVFAPLHMNNYLRQLPQSIVDGVFLDRIPSFARPIVRGLNGLLSSRSINRWQPDVLHETYFQSRPGSSPDIPRVVTVYDMIHEHFPGQFWTWDRTSAHKRRSVSRAEHVICISESTRRDLIDMFDVSPDKTSVVHLAYERFAETQAGHSRGTGMPEPFILYVGHRGGYKNFDRLLAAYAASSQVSGAVQLVCFGGGALSSAERARICELGLEGRVHCLSGDDSRLGEAYSLAEALVYPSLYEGFGLPPLEAMAHDCPVVCSDTSSLPEVVGDAGEYFAPMDIDSIRAALERVVGSAERRNELVVSGRRRLEHFSWQKCAQETLAVYERVANG